MWALLVHVPTHTHMLPTHTQKGDVVECEVDEIGTIRNVIE